MKERFSLKWNDFQSNVSKSFSFLRNEEYLHDVTLVGDDHRQLPAHKLVLSACSEYFKDIFKNNKHSHPLLCLDGIKNDELNNILDYIYNGEVQIYQENLEQFLSIAQRFKLKGLLGNLETVTNDNDNYQKNGNIPDDKIDTETTAVDDSGIKMDRITLDNSDKAALNVEGLNEVDEKIVEYIETCSDGSYRCKVCGKISRKSLKQNQMQNVRNHIETHMEGLSYACSICYKSFKSRNSLSNHRSVYHK